MSSRPPWRELAALGLAAVCLRLVAAVLIPDPAYLDAAYYELVARRLASGDGLSVPVVWSFLDTGGTLPANPALPIPSNRHWMPMTGLVSGAFMATLGTSRLAAELPHALLGAALVPATGWIGWWLWRSRYVAVVSGLLALFAGPMLVYVPMVDSFALFGAFGTGALAAAIAAIQQPRPGMWIVASALCVAIATLTRVDGVILAAAPATAWGVRRGVGPWRTDAPSVSWLWPAAAAAVAGLVVAPWLVRQFAEFGSIFPSAGGRLLWLSSFNQQFSITADASPIAMLDDGLVPVIGARLEAFVQVLGRTAVLLGGFFLLPFLYGLWKERSRAELAPFVVYWLALFALMVVLFTVHAPAGAWYHSAWAWLPFAIPLAVANALPMLTAASRHLPALKRSRNIRFLRGAALVGAVVLSLVGSSVLAIQWDRDRDKVEAAGGFLLENARRTDVVMYVDPPSLNLVTGNPTVAPPFDPPETIREVAAAYGVAWVVVERATGASVDALGLWDGAPWLSERPAFEARDVRIYETRLSATSQSPPGCGGPRYSHRRG